MSYLPNRLNDRPGSSSRRRAAAGALLGAVALALAGVAHAAYPERPITLILPVPPGSSSDIAARAVAAEASKTLGQTVVVENRAGAHGVIGMQAVRGARPDGYTIGVVNVGTLAVTPELFTRKPYDPVRDFKPITLGWSFPSVLFVPGSSPVKTVAELVAAIKAKPDSYASQGPGSGGHLLGEQFRLQTGVDATHVPYKGSLPALQDVMAARVAFSFDGASLDKAQWVKEGRLRAIAIAARNRSELFPGVPTMREAGFPGVEMDIWFGLVGPAGLSDPIVHVLNAAFVSALKTAQANNQLQGFEVYATSPREFAERIAADVAHFAPIVKQSGVQVEH
ncbi:Tripartite tricarboxylate transporter family receptor [Pigmentiphaga humi]|uniref:Tripartite tricarboxylate transporter family receptor n=1 Tax=Pigmentiphaga humi TaxID=2478468 RepID=A0A3P4B2B3_9BURK|nr:tripartite tricarboxylate transporter substrate-binding protein [Pigmentiphaga humi]VCU70427.1 Tripartite tricarboxylate transporter family receptor [Pigmentiphaga humi]